VTATSNLSYLTFNFRSDDGFISIDAIAVAVPEPSTWALASLRLLGRAWRRRAVKQN